MSTVAPAGRRLRRIGRCLVLLLAAAGGTTAAAARSAPLDGEALRSLPIAFEPNHGQSDARVLYFARGRGYAVFVARDEAVLALSNGAGTTETVVRLAFGRGPAPPDGAAPAPASRGAHDLVLRA